MTSILKNQIIKHLSKFVKNLSPDKINLSTLRGEGDLTNLELDEKVLISLLELPNWLSLDRAWCNRVSIRIPWTKLKSVPICLNLDEVHVSMATCSELRQSSPTFKPPTYATGGKYGFIDKVIDGITVRINSLIIDFKSPAFEASLQFSRILLESSSPSWQSCTDLRFSRLKDTDLGLILLFKELQWQTLRVEARSTTCDISLPPIRLITNLSRCRITLKKRFSDCAVIGCRLVLIMDELLWVLTDAQLSAAISFLQSLSHLIEQDTLINQRFKAARKLETLPEYHAQREQQQQHERAGQPGTAAKTPSALGRVFARYDVLETSYHFFSEKIDFHFCDDPGDGRSTHPELKDGGALQVTLTKLQIDSYPYHWAAPEGGNNRKHWLHYEEGPPSRWVYNGIEQFAKQLLHFDLPVHAKLTRASPHDSTPASTSPSIQKISGGSNNPLHGSITQQLRKLMSSCLVLRLGDVTLYRVTTAKSRQSPKEFIIAYQLAQERKRRLLTGDRLRFPLPDSIPIIHMELTQFYYPGDVEFPQPQPKCFVQLNPIQVNFDCLTVLWLHSFTRALENTLSSLTSSKAESAKSTHALEPQLEIRLEALMPRVVFELPGWDRPKSMQLQASRVVASNFRSLDGGSRADLMACLEKFQGHGEHGAGGSGLCYSSVFPAKEDDLSPISDTLLKHAMYSQPPHTLNGWKRDLLWSKDPAHVWYIHLDPFWADFYMTSHQTLKPKAAPFIGTVPLTAWIQPDPERISALLQLHSLISVQLDRAEYVFLLRVMEVLKETAAFLDHQEKQFKSTAAAASMVFAAIIPQIDISILYPPLAASTQQQSVYGESPMGDEESIYPDTSSMTDLGQLSRSLQGTKLHNSRSECMISKQSTTEAVEIGSVTSLSIEGGTIGISKSHSDSTIEISGVSDEPSCVIEDFKANLVNSSRIVTFASDRPQSHELHQPQATLATRTGLNSMKRGFSNLMSTVDAALKHTPQTPTGDEFDGLSIRSDGSSDSENFVVLHGDLGDHVSHDGFAFYMSTKATNYTPTAIESATDAAAELEEAAEVRADTPTNSEPSSAGPITTVSNNTPTHSRETAVITFHINDLELINQAIGSVSSLRLQAGHLSCSECISISREEFQAKFASRSRGWREVQIGTIDSSRITAPPIRVRMEQKMEFDPSRIDLSDSIRDAVAASIDAWVEASVAHLNLPLLLSSVTGLTAFVEDELVAPVVPLFISLRDIELVLTEDRPPVRVGGPPPAPPPPMVMRIKHLLVQRSHTGVISMGVAETKPSSISERNSGNTTSHETKEAALRLRIEELERENRELKKRLHNTGNRV